MKSLFRRMPAWSLAPLALLLCVSAHADRLTVPEGTDVPLVFDQALSSKYAKEGDRVRLHVAENIMVDGKTVIKEGAPVTGIVTKVDKRKHFGVNAKIKLSLNPVESVTGQAIPLDPGSKGKVASGSRTDHAALTSGGAAIVLGPIGLVGGFFVVGKEVNIKPGDHVHCGVASDTTLRMK